MRFVQMRWLFFCISFLMVPLLHAGVLTFHNRICTDFNCTPVIGDLSCAATLTDVFPKTGNFSDVKINDIITLGVDHNNPKYFPNPYICIVTLKIESSDKNNLLLPIQFKDIAINYNPFTSANLYLDKASFIFNNAYAVFITITDILVNNVAVNTLPENLYIDDDISVERYYDFTVVATDPVLVYNPVPLDIDCDGINDELLVTWEAEQGAEEYQLEWTFVNDYDYGIGNYISATNLDYNFKNNSTRITTTSAEYKITLAFEHGYLLCRMRAIGRDVNNPAINIVGAWNIADNGIVADISSNQNFQVQDPHEPDKNWQYNATFAEEGKKKEVLGYFDGSLRNRQQVTKNNSDKNVLVGETVYDFQGRPAVTVLPVPVVLPTCTTQITNNEPAIKYYPKFNLDDSATTHKYLRDDFDPDNMGDSCGIYAGPMSISSGASNYYSSANPDKTGFQAFLPDAQKYPFTQTQFTPDNTGRIKKQSGVGPQFQIGSEHETQYVYGQPNQLELDRMFGSEAGDAAHYKKNVVVDANGQASITYLDQEGRTVATCLAGDSKTDSAGQFILAPIPSQANALKNISIDLFAKDAVGHSNLNTVSTSADGLIFNSQLTVAYSSPYYFNYNISVDTMGDACLRQNICFSCVYDLEIKVTDDCGQLITPTPSSLSTNPVKKHIGHFTVSGNDLVFNVNCTNSTVFTDAESFTLNLTPGNYTVNKILTVNSQARDFYVKQFLDSANNQCVKTLYDFQYQYLSQIDTSNCNISCMQCEQSLGDRDAWVASGKGTELQFDFLFEQCGKPCKPRTLCEAEFEQMLMDVSPDGQYGEYFQYLSTGNAIDPSVFPLSVFNEINILPQNISSHTGNWRFPQVKINGSTYPYYLDEEGNRSIIKLIQISSGVYSPDVKNNSSVYVKYDNAGGFWYTYPENLKFFSDFKNYWNPNWAKSLVQYHPEYCYYIACEQFGIRQSGDNLTSDDFDRKILNAYTFQDAITAGFIKSSYLTIPNPNNRINDFFSVSTTYPYDPFATHAVFQSYVPSGNSFNIHSTMVNDFISYQIINSLNFSMVQFAALTARCGSDYAANFTSACYDFGKDYYPSGPAYLNDSIRNKEWTLLKNMYLSEKKKIQKKVQDLYALYSCGKYNGCIGNSSFDPFSAGMIISPYLSSPYFNHLQPCACNTAARYAHKKKKFVDYNDVPGQSVNQIAHQIYLQTGQTPIAVQLQSLLGALAAHHKLIATGEPLVNYFEFTPDLYNVLAGANPPSVMAPYQWNTISSSGNILSVNIVNASTNSVQCTFSLDKTGSGITNWSDIISFRQLHYTTTSGGQFNFQITAVLNAPANSVNPYIYKTITGSSCFDISNYNFQLECNANAFAMDISNLMSALALNGQLTSALVNLQTSGYQGFITAPIRNMLGTLDSNLIWNYTGAGQFQLHDANVTGTKILISFDSYTPSSFSSSNLNTIKGFTGMKSDSSNLFLVNGVDSSGHQVVTIIGDCLKQSPDFFDPQNISMGTCGLPQPFNCQGQGYEARQDLENILKDVLTKQPFNADINLAQSPFYTNLIKSYFPSRTVGTTGQLVSNNSTGQYSETLHIFYLIDNDTNNSLYTNDTSCKLSLSHFGNAPPTLSFANLTDIKNLTGVSPQDLNGNFFGFYFIGQYNIGGQPFFDTIWGSGTSCIPILNCIPVVVRDTFISPHFNQYDNPCAQYQIHLALENGQSAYNQYRDSIITVINDRYTKHCLGALENFASDYQDKEYHFTLYYYDQPGNLVRTIPPEGVNLLNITSTADLQEQRIISDRTYGQQTVFTNHVLATTYEYNSLNQLVKQSVPDHDKMQIWEFTLPNGLDSRLVTTATQFLDASKGYLSGYIQMTTTARRGYLYSTNDGGQTWQRLYDLVASNMNKMQMISFTDGYAVGNEGILLRTADGGNTWDMVPTYTKGIVQQLNDLYFTSAGNGIVVGSGIALNVANNVIMLAAGISATDTLTSVTYDGSVFYAAGRNASGVGVVYQSNTQGTVWTLQTQFTSLDLNKVQFLQPSLMHGFAAGTEGTLLFTKNAGAVWNNVATSTTKPIRDVFFANDNVGVAIMDSIAGFGQIYKTADGGKTWALLSKPGEYFNAMSFYPAGSSFKGVAVGRKGIVRRIVANANLASPYFGIIAVNFPVNTINIKAVFAYPTANNTLSIMVAGNNADIYYTSNGSDAVLNWTAVNTFGAVPPNDASFKNMAFYINGSNLILGTILSISGKIYSFRQNTSGSFNLFATATACNFTDLKYNGGFFYSFDNIGKQLYRIYVPNTGNPTAMLISGVNTSVVSPASLDFTSANRINIVGSNGIIFQSSNATSNSVTWIDQSASTRPLPLNDIQAIAANTIYAVGNDGTILQTINGSQWQTMAGGTAKKLNAIKFSSSGAGLIAGEQGTLYRHAVNGNSITLTSIPLSANKNLNDIALAQNAVAYIAGDNGTMIYIANSNTPVPISAVPQPQNINFKGVSFLFGSSSGVLAVGTGNAVYNYVSVSGAKIKEIFTPGINALNFADANNGYIVGDDGIIRSTASAGNSWKSVVPQVNGNGVPDFLTVWNTKIGKATVAGTGDYIGQTTTTGSVLNFAGYAYSGNSANRWNNMQFHPYFSNNGFIVGSGKRAYKIAMNPATGAIVSIATLPVISGVFDFRALHIFRDNSFIAVGTSGKAYFYNGTTWTNQSPNFIPSNSILNDVYFHDDRTGYIAGDNGILVKCVSPTNIQTLPALPWTPMPLKDEFNITINSQADVKVIAFSDRYNGMVGGKYNFTNTSQYPYARLLRDEADLFSTFFWYDRLGRLVVSENTKQFNKTPRAYSYTLYDALGRITEVGEKAENNGSTKQWASVFGTMVNTFFNPRAINDSLLRVWINNNSGSRTEVTHTYYDEQTILPSTVLTQQNLRKRVVSATYEDVNDNNPLTYQHATHYSYDIHGNVNTLVQENKQLAVGNPQLANQQYKRIDYDYDLISGKVNDVHYQSGQTDAFHHHYEYDADNRVTQAYTSHLPTANWQLQTLSLWDLDAKYFYYAHGPLARAEIGDLQVQGIDYAYTLQGWIKGVNSNILKPENDIGQDGQTASINKNFALDAFGYSLGYFQNDYNPIVTLSAVEGSFAEMTGSNLLSARHDLYNGNISSMATTIVPPTLNNNTVTYSPLPQGTAYQYDQLNRLLEMQAYQNLGTNTANSWDNNVTYSGMYQNTFTYDANGNILTQLRKDESGVAINDLTYNRFTNNNRIVQNRLYSVNDAVANTTFADDIDDQGIFNNTSTAVNTANNYGYDEIGNLKRDDQKQIAQIKWTVYGKIKELTRTTGSIKKNLKFDYDAFGNRIAKHIYTSANVWEKSEYYVRDAQGNVMSIYKYENNPPLQSFAQIEKDIYGSSRLGVDKTFTEMIGAPPADTTSFTRILGNKNYDGTNHLGNVLSTFTDKKFAISLDNVTIDHYVPDVLSANDYYPFGVKMKARSFNSTNNRYQFNGKEFDDETETTDYGARVQDGDLGGFLSIDPLTKKFPELTPYQFASNRPIDGIDMDGLEYATFTIFIQYGKVAKINVEKDYDLKAKNTLGPGIQYNYVTLDKNGKMGKFEMKFEENMYGIYQGDKNPMLPEVGGDPNKLNADYSLTPIDEEDAAALKHDKAYDALNPQQAGLGGVMDNSTTPANSEAANAANNILERFKKGDTDKITGKKITFDEATGAIKMHDGFSVAEFVKKYIIKPLKAIEKSVISSVPANQSSPKCPTDK